jgi:hypothetical protein
MALVCILAVVLLSGCGAAGAAPSDPAAARPAGTIVYASDDNRLTTFDVASGSATSRRIRSVPACGAQLFVTGGHIVFSAFANGRTTVYSIPLSLDRRPTRLGTAHMLVPSATDGRVWLAGTDCDRRRMVGVREVAVDGQVTFETDRRVPGPYVTGAVPDGLVVHRRRAMFVWDPVSGTDRRLGLEWIFGVRGSLPAGCAAASDCDDLAIVDSASGRTVSALDGGRHELDMGAAFSPDGTLLATPARAGRRWSVALVDTRTGTHTIIPGSRTRKAYPELGWSPSSGWLFIRAGRTVKAYRPGARRAEALPLRLPVSVVAFAAA